jgi:glycosyltransferase involved in cell wall biosynthesis
MTPAPGPTVRLVPAGAAIPGAEGALSVDGDMAIALPDRSAARIDASSLLQGATSDAAFALIVECRRVLQPGGRLAAGAHGDVLQRLANLAGLSRVDGEYTKPHRQVEGNPLVSVVIPAFRPRFFATALASALGQDYEPLEFLVCDDSGSGEIEAIARQASRQRPVRYRRNPSRLRHRGNLARGLDEARGEFVKYLSDDDVLAPDCVATLVDAFRRAPDIVLATSWRRRIDAHGGALPDQPATRPIAPSDVVLAGPALANAMVLAGLNIVGEPSTVLFRRSDFSDNGADRFAFDGVPCRGAVDMAMWANLLLRGNAVWYRRPLSSFRIHPEQSQQDPTRWQRAVDGIRSLQRTWLALGLHERLRPREVLCQTFPPSEGSDWQWSAVPALATVFANAWRNPPSDRWQYGIARSLGASRGDA